MPRCVGIKRDGAQCTTIVKPPQTHCYQHDPARAEERRRNASRAGKSTRKGSSGPKAPHIGRGRRRARRFPGPGACGRGHPGIQRPAGRTGAGAQDPRARRIGGPHRGAGTAQEGGRGWGA